MSENTKRFKDFRSTLHESEYKETLTGYPNRGIDTDVGPANANLLMKVNAVLNSLNRFTYQNANDAMVKIRTRLNLFMLDFPWTPWMWQSNMSGTFGVPITLYGRVDGWSGTAGAGGIRVDGKASPDAGLQEFVLSVTVETAEDGLYRVTAKLAPKVDIVPEGVEEDGDAVTEDYQTDARAREISNKIEKHETKAQSGYAAKMTQSGKAAARGRRQEAKHDAASRRLMKRDEKEQDSPRTYGRGGKLIKRGSRREVQEEIEVIDELLTPMRDAITARERDKATADYNNPNLSAAQQKKAGARASRAMYARLRARSNDGTVAGKAQTPKFKRENEKWRKAEKSVKEEVEAIEEMHKVGDTVKVPHKGKMVKGKIVRHDKGGSGKAAQHGGGYVVDVGEYSSITVPSHKIVKEEAEQIDELSKKTLGSYVKKAAKDIEDLSSDSDFYLRGAAYREFDKTRAKIRQRHAGVGKAVKRLTKEGAEQIDEAGQAKLERLGKAYDKARIGSRGVLNPERKKRLGDAYFKMRDKVSDKQKKRNQVKEEAELAESGAAKAARLAKAKERAGKDGDVERFDRASAVQRRIAKRLHAKKGRAPAMSEALVGGQKRLDVNKNKRLDSQDFALLRAKKKTVKEYTEMMPGISLQVPAPTEARADKSGKGKRFHKGAIKSVEEAVAKGKKKKPSTHQGAANVIARQSKIKRTIEKQGMRSFGDW